MTLREARILFTKLKSELILWIGTHNFEGNFGKVEVFEAEGFAYQERLVRVGMEKKVVTDAVHISTSRHYQGLAVDLCIFLDGEYITSGEHPIWKFIDAKARELHPKLGLGRSFKDANHLSWNEGDHSG